MSSLLSESFEGSGYENSWAETLGAGNTANEDSAAVARPTGGGSQILETTLAGTNAQAFAQQDLGSNQTVIYMTGFLYVASSSGTADTTPEPIFIMDGFVNNILVDLRYTPSRGWFLRYQRYSGGIQPIGDLDGSSNDNLQIATDTWYRLGMYYNSDADECEGRLWDASGTLIDSATESGLSGRVDSRYVQVGPSGAKTGATTLYWDLIEVDDADWPAAPGSGAADAFIEGLSRIAYGIKPVTAAGLGGVLIE